MPPKSKIITLPDNVKAFIDESLKENRLTQSEITQKACEMLEQQGYDEESIFSVMSLNRYAKVYYRMIKTQKEAEQIYKMLSEQNPETNFDVNDATVAQTKILVARELQKLNLGEIEFDVDLVNKLTLISKRLSETEQKVRTIKAQSIKEYRIELEHRVDELAKNNKKGITAETVKIIKSSILGIPEEQDSGQ